jgi:hypothetical protein
MPNQSDAWWLHQEFPSVAIFITCIRENPASGPDPNMQWKQSALSRLDRQTGTVPEKKQYLLG